MRSRLIDLGLDDTDDMNIGLCCIMLTIHMELQGLYKKEMILYIGSYLFFCTRFRQETWGSRLYCRQKGQLKLHSHQFIIPYKLLRDIKVIIHNADCPMPTDAVVSGLTICNFLVETY